MSVKAMSLVWDLFCPQGINGLEFKSSHKYVLIAYADHADHHGKNIWPAVKTIADKTGLDERSIQRLTRDVEKMGLLVDDGKGPRGTRRWKLPYNDTGDKIAPVVLSPTEGGDKNDKSLGDISLGDISLGDKLPDELKEQNLSNNISIKYTDVWVRVLNELKEERPRGQFETWIASSRLLDFQDGTLIIGARNDYARDWLENQIGERSEELSGYFVKFVVETVNELEQVQR